MTTTGPGSTTVTAALGSEQGNTSLNVLTATLQSLVVAPNNAQVALGGISECCRPGYFPGAGQHHIVPAGRQQRGHLECRRQCDRELCERTARISHRSYNRHGEYLGQPHGSRRERGSGRPAILNVSSAPARHHQPGSRKRRGSPGWEPPVPRDRQLYRWHTGRPKSPRDLGLVG